MLRIRKKRNVRESAMSDAEYRRSIAEEVCDALNMAASGNWEITEEPGDNFITVRSDSENAMFDGTFCEVEITNNFVLCFAYPEREGGDYVLIGKFRCLDRDLLDKVVALDGCGSECASESCCMVNRSRARRFEKKRRKFEGAGAGMLITVENVDTSNADLVSLKDNRDGTFTMELKNVVLEGVRIRTYEWSTSYSRSKVPCDVVVNMEADPYYDMDEEKLRNRLSKMKSQPKSYGIKTYSADLSFCTLSCGGGWSHMSLADGFDAEAYEDELYDWRNMGNNGTVTLWWEAPNGSSVEDDMIITSIYVVAGSVLEDFYQESEDEWLSSGEEDEGDEEYVDDGMYEDVSRRSCRSESICRRNVSGRKQRKHDR